MPKSYFSKGFWDFRNFVVQQNCMIQDVLSSGYDLYVMRNRRIVLRQRWCDRSFLVESVGGHLSLEFLPTFIHNCFQSFKQS